MNRWMLMLVVLLVEAYAGFVLHDLDLVGAAVFVVFVICFSPPDRAANSRWSD